ncbi:MAG TPA: amino acid adenylation domain-containing protein [Pyrinomonadaceae bacterium]|nr:amino acid adenylation domain-containing protein [Pyrinomonadaceae bacterium]
MQIEEEISFAEVETEGYRLSPQQKQTWLAEQEWLAGQPQSAETPYTASATVELSGELRRGALAAAIAEVEQRHEILRTRCESLSGVKIPVQVIGRGGEVLQWRLRETAQGRHELELRLPALCADRAGLRNLVREVAECYEAQAGKAESVFADEPMQYAVVSEWLNELLASEDTEAGKQYWLQQDLSALSEVKLPFETPAVNGPSFEPQSLRQVLPAEVSAKLEALAAERGTTVEVVLLACWCVLLSRLTGAGDIIIGAAFDGRTDEELEAALGLFVRYLPVRCRVEQTASVLEVVEQLSETARNAAQWQECFDGQNIAGASEQGQEEDGHGELPYQFEYAADGPAFDAADLRFDVLREQVCVAPFRLKLACLTRLDSTILTEWHYDASLYQAADVERLGRQYLTLLQSIARAPQARVCDVEVVGGKERQQLLAEWNDTRREYARAGCLHELFEQQAQRTPAAPALSFEGEELSYAELDARANQLAHYLRESGVGPEVMVGMMLERSAEMVVAILGILKAGGAYVPLDPEYPQERLSFMLSDSGARVLLTQESLAGLLPAESLNEELRVVALDAVGEELRRQSAEGLGATGVTPDNLAYVIYTSGSTGRPKGVMISHRSILNRLLWMVETFAFDASDRTLLKTSVSFDASVWELFVPLFSGGTLVVARPGGQREVSYLLEVVAARRVTTLQLVPSMLRMVLGEAGEAEVAERWRSLRRMFCGGEALPGELAASFQRAVAGAPLCNLYGPTEASIDATAWPLDGAEAETDGVVTLGRPIANVQVYVLDAQQRVAPTGVAGEIYLGGRGLARGYLRRPGLTAEKFIPHPFSTEAGERLYRTGDVGRWDAQGRLHYLGRADQQVKVRGYRIELGEIETALRSHAGVRDAVVTVREDAGTEPRLVAYMVGARQGLLERLRQDGQQSNGHGEPRPLHRLPNGLEIAYVNKNEADILYQELFADEGYLKHGVTLRDGDTVFDVGANIGLFTLFVHSRCRGARTYSFEPIPKTYAALRRNVELYGLEGKAYESGVSRESGRATFTFYPQVSASSGMYADAAEEERVTRAFMGNQGEELAAFADELMAGRFEAEQYECQLRTVSEVVAEEGVERIDLLKVDVEKAELDVLEGIAEEDWAKIRQVVLEVHDTGGRLEKVEAMLRRHGFQFVTDQYKPFENTGLYNIFGVHPLRNEEPAASPSGEASKSAAAALLETTLTVGDLRAHLGERLPEYMIPSHFVMLDEIPLMPNGKVDRKALPAPEQSRPEFDEDFVAPRTPVEEILGAVWGEVLNLERVGAEDNFFALGGHSLLATQVISRLRKVFRVEVPLRDLFEAPTVSEMAQRIEAALKARPELAAPAIVPVERGGDLPVSIAQQRLWFLDQLEPGNTAYNIASVTRLKGRLDVAALERCLQEVVRRHESLRTKFVEVEGHGRQVIMPASEALPQIPVVDLSGLEEGARGAEVERRAREEQARPFKLSEGGLLRCQLLRLGDEEHVALFTMHHIVSDGWSMGVLIREVAALYEAFVAGEDSPLPPLAVQYGDYAAWQREWLQGEVLAAQLDYWKRQLGGAPDVLRLPTDRPRPAVRSYRGGRHFTMLPPELAAALKELNRREGATLFMTLLAAYNVLLARYSGQQDISVGSATANRQRAEIENLIGFFVNTLVLRTDLSGDPTFAELLGRVREVALGAYAHQDVPLEMLVEALQPERSLSHQSLFQVIFVLQNIPRQVLELPGLQLSGVPVASNVSKFDLALVMEEAGDGLAAHWEYSADLFDPATIASMANNFVLLLGGIAARPEARLSELQALIDVAEQDHRRAEKKKLEESNLKKFKRIKPKAISVPEENLVQTGALRADTKLPLVLQPGADQLDLVEWARNQRPLVERLLLAHGALLFRGFRIDLNAEFEPFAHALCDSLFNENGEHPRQAVSGKVYTPTFYPHDKQLLWHNENSFNHQWPTKILFGCVRPAQTGGETPVADSRLVYQLLAPEIREQFAAKQVMYVRNYGQGLGLDWQTVFRTTDRARVEEHCRRTGMEFEWKSGDRLMTRQVRPAVVRHPKTGDPVWFNQAQHWHISCLDAATRESLVALFPEEDLPRHCYYGDGSRIEDGVMAEILDVYRRLEVKFPWQAGDILMLDNLLTAHGRNPYTGERKLLVAMGEMLSYDEV